MSIDGPLLTQLVSTNMITLILGLFVVRAMPITLRSFQAAYLIIGGANIALHHVYIPEVNIVYPMISLAAGIVIVLLMTGIFGKLNSSVHYETALVAVGLFPWYLGWKISLIYVGTVLLFCVIVQGAKMLIAFNAVNRNVTSLEKVKKTLSEDQQKLFQKKITTIFTTPIGVAAITTAVIVSLRF